MALNISNSKIGMLNTGMMKDVQSITVSITTLENSGAQNAAAALTSLTEAVVQSNLTPEQKTECLDLLTELSCQAALPDEKRLKAPILKAMCVGLASTMGFAAGVAQVWTTWGPALTKFLNI